MKLSPHFALAEFTASSAAKGAGIANTPTNAHLANLYHLACYMELVRDLFGKPITVTSAYRNPKVNALVGGVPTSAHALGLAVDFRVKGVSDYDTACFLRDSAARLPPWDQLIYEKGRCVHLGIGPGKRQHVRSQPGGPGSAVLEGIKP